MWGLLLIFLFHSLLGGLSLRMGGGVAGGVYTTTRKQALIDFICALQMDDGSFVNRLNDPPPDEPSIYVGCNALPLLSWLDALDRIDLERAVEYCASLQKPDGSICIPIMVSMRCAVDLLYAAGAIDRIDVEAAVRWILSLQREDGGFNNSPFTFSDYVWCTAEAIIALTELEAEIPNREKVISYLCSHLREDGGFALYPDCNESSMRGTYWTVLALHYLNALDHIPVDKTAEYVMRGYDEELQTFTPQTLAGICDQYIVLALLGALDRVNVSAAADLVLSLQSPLHGGFVSSRKYLYKASKETITGSRSLVEVLFRLGELDRLDEEFTVQERPEWRPPPPVTPRPEDVVNWFVAVVILVSPVLFILSIPTYILIKRSRRKGRKAVRIRRRRR